MLIDLKKMELLNRELFRIYHLKFFQYIFKLELLSLVI